MTASLLHCRTRPARAVPGPSSTNEPVPLAATQPSHCTGAHTASASRSETTPASDVCVARVSSDGTSTRVRAANHHALRLTGVASAFMMIFTAGSFTFVSARARRSGRSAGAISLEWNGADTFSGIARRVTPAALAAATASSTPRAVPLMTTCDGELMLATSTQSSDPSSSSCRIASATAANAASRPVGTSATMLMSTLGGTAVAIASPRTL